MQFHKEQLLQAEISRLKKELQDTKARLQVRILCIVATSH